MADDETDFDAARRLWDILSESSKQDGGQPARVVWARLLGRSPDDRAGLYRGLALLLELVNEVEKGVTDCPGANAKLLLEKLPTIRKGVGVMQLDGTWSNAPGPIFSELVLRDLLFCSNELRRFRPEKKIEADTLTELAKEADDLFNAVLESKDIDPELRTVLLGCLETFRRAIADYRIVGAEGLRKAAAEMLGELLIVRDKVKKNEKHALMQRMWGLVTKVNTAVSLAKNYNAIVETYRAVQLALSAADPSVPPRPPTDVLNV